MVLSPQNSGKYLSRSWAEARADAPIAHVADELTWLEVPVVTVPEGAYIDAAGHDIRNRPEVGA
jgi:hypothetical protein